MTNDVSRGGGDQHARVRFADGGMQLRPGIAVVKRIADAEDVSPMALPRLNETVDPDALDDLFDGVDVPGRGELPLVSFRYADHRVRVAADGWVTLSQPDETPLDDDWSHVSAVDAARDCDVATRVVEALADYAEYDPMRVRSAVADAVDLDAVRRLNQRRQNGAPRTGASVAFSVLGYDVVVGPNGTISVGSALKRLKRTGGNVLVVGAVPDDLVDAASVTLLGERGRDRRHVFALLDRDADAIASRLAPADASAARVVDYAATSRSASSVRPADVDADPIVADEPETIDDLEAAIDASLRSLAADGGDSEPAAIRLCVDSLRPILEERDVDGAGAFLESVCESVKSTSALAHYVLPIDRTSDVARRLEALFDATVELRVGENGAEQRWHLHESDYTTAWFALRDSR